MSLLRYSVESSNKSGYNDANKAAENLFKDIFNSIYGWDLTNLNEIENNYPAIDLSDKNEKLCIQITSKNDKTKIKKDTLDKINTARDPKAKSKKTQKNEINKSHFEGYDRVIVFIIGKKRGYRTDFDSPHINFSKEKDIIDINDLLKIIDNKGLDKQREIVEILDEHLLNVVRLFTKENHPLRWLEYKTEFKGKIDLFYKFCEENDSFYEIDPLKFDILELKSLIQDLPPKARKILFSIILLGHEEDLPGAKPKVKIGYGELILNTNDELDNQQLKSIIGQLKNKGLLTISTDLDNIDTKTGVNIHSGEQISLGTNFCSHEGSELFILIKLYLKSDHEKLKKIIIDCDFSPLTDSF